MAIVIHVWVNSMAHIKPEERKQKRCADLICANGERAQQHRAEQI